MKQKLKQKQIQKEKQKQKQKQTRHYAPLAVELGLETNSA